jgi:cytochrome c peroxidase
MKSRIFPFGFLILPVVGFTIGVLFGTSPNSRENISGPIVGNVQTFEAAYARWKADAEQNGQQTKLVLSLGYFRGLSSEATHARGGAEFDLTSGALSVEVTGLPEGAAFDVWLVDNQTGPGRSVKPESGDRMIRAGALVRHGDRAILRTSLQRESLAGFKLDLLVVSPEGRQPTDRGLLYGSPNVFQKLYYAESPLRQLVVTGLSDSRQEPRPLTHLLLAPFRSVIPSLAYAAGGGNPHLADLIAQGEKLFFEEKFHGNGRTCGTCHPADNNFTIDPAYIATLPKNDPLFVAESKRELNSDTNGGKFFEVPSLMRQAGLILENVDGFDDLAHKFVLRGVPHLLGLGLSITPATSFNDGTSTSVAEDRTGWGGDGAPSLREFALRAVVQHFTRTLDRIPGVDFRFPTDDELDAIEAFLLSLGPQEELDLNNLKLSDDNAKAGLELFNGSAKCSLCHFDAGANHSLSGIEHQGRENANFNTGVEDAASRSLPSGLSVPRDGGFGTEDLSGNCQDLANPDCSFGNGSFNTPSLIEAADTPPFFHNNSVSTLEQAIGFYNLFDFNGSPAAMNPLIGSITLVGDQPDQIAAFLRVINSLENIRSAGTRLTGALAAANPPRADKFLDLATVDIRGAIRVLSESPLCLHCGSGDAQAILASAATYCDTARKTGNKVKRDASIRAAMDALAQARGKMVN